MEVSLSPYLVSSGSWSQVYAGVWPYVVYLLKFVGDIFFLDYLFEYRVDFVGGMFLDPALELNKRAVG